MWAEVKTKPTIDHVVAHSVMCSARSAVLTLGVCVVLDSTICPVAVEAGGSEVLFGLAGGFGSFKADVLEAFDGGCTGGVRGGGGRSFEASGGLASFEAGGFDSSSPPSATSFECSGLSFETCSSWMPVDIFSSLMIHRGFGQTRVATVASLHVDQSCTRLLLSTPAQKKVFWALEGARVCSRG